jgi:hypothetical protein
MAITDQVERAILDAVRQVPADQLAGVLDYIRGLSPSGATDPEVYAGITPGGMSFEIPPGQIRQFLCLLVDTLEVDEVIISFKRGTLRWENGRLLSRMCTDFGRLTCPRPTARFRV